MDNTRMGGWSPYRDGLTQEEKDLFKTSVTSKITGVDYTALAVASQVVAGMNYNFFCNAKGVYPDAPNYAVIITVYKPVSGEAHITAITRIG
jgi:hypothetical protein